MSAYTGLQCFMQALIGAEGQLGRHQIVLADFKGSDRCLARGELGTIENVHIDGPHGRIILRCTHGLFYLKLAPGAAHALRALQSLTVNMPESERLHFDVTEFRDAADGQGSLAGGGVKILGGGS